MSKPYKELKNLAQRVNRILKEELSKSTIKPNMANVRVYNIRSVGVQGDERTYSYPVEIELKQRGKFVWDIDLLVKLSTRITNEVKGVNRVVYVITNAYK